MMCPICNAQHDKPPDICDCGTPLRLKDSERESFRTHAKREFRRNLKGLFGFAFLIYVFGGGTLAGLGIMFGSMFDSYPQKKPTDPLAALAVTAFFAAPAYFFVRAFGRRWKRIRHYRRIANGPLEYFPPRAPGLSDKQYAAEIQRLGQIDGQMHVERLATGEIETDVIERLPDEIRSQHVWIPGLPGYGKSTLMHWMAVEDIRNGKGMTVIDPAGDLVGNGLPDDPDRHVPGLIDWIPYERINDTIYLDLKTPVPIDFFTYRDEDEKQELAGNLVELFNRLGEMFGGQQGVRFTGIVRDIVYTLFEAKDAGCPTSFIDIYDFIKDPDRRKEILNAVSAKSRAIWDKFPNDEKTEPIISRLSAIARNPRLRSIFGMPDAKLRIADMMDARSIFLINIHGAPEAGIILGTMILSQLLQAGLRRSELPRQRRVPHHIYLDEFQNFRVGTDTAKILSQCRKYNLCMTVANQYTDQLPENTLSAVFGGISTWFLFRLSPKDIPFFPKNLPSIAYEGVYKKVDPNEEIPDYLGFLKDKDAKPETRLVDLKPLPFDPKILATLQVGEAIHRKADGSAQKVKTHPMGERPHVSFANLIRERTLKQYAPESRQQAAQDLSSKRDEPEPERSIAFPNEGATRGPRRSR